LHPRCTALHVIGEILPVGRRLTWEVTLLGLMAGFLLALATELVLRSPAADRKTRALLTPPATEPNSLPGGHRSNPFVGARRAHLQSAHSTTTLDEMCPRADLTEVC
jgi:hypothetical protein